MVVNEDELRAMVQAEYRRTHEQPMIDSVYCMVIERFHGCWPDETQPLPELPADVLLRLEALVTRISAVNGPLSDAATEALSVGSELRHALLSRNAAVLSGLVDDEERSLIDGCLANVLERFERAVGRLEAGYAIVSELP